MKVLFSQQSFRETSQRISSERFRSRCVIFKQTCNYVYILYLALSISLTSNTYKAQSLAFNLVFVALCCNLLLLLIRPSSYYTHQSSLTYCSLTPSFARYLQSIHLQPTYPLTTLLFLLPTHSFTKQPSTTYCTLTTLLLTTPNSCLLETICQCLSAKSG